jgi:Flp pilus assembly protein TadG
MLGSLIRRFLLDRRGNIAIIFALALVPIIFLAGMALDFTSALGKRTLLNAAADSAALSAVSPATMNQTVATAQTTAQNVFMGQASTVAGANYSAPTVSVTQNGLVRTATVSYSASSVNSFPNVLKQTAWPITGTATATATVPPNIDFYLLLDNSPSMNIAATTSGINTMVANTSAQGGCAFACHQSNPAADSLGNPGGVDNYTLAKNLGVVTRIQNMAAATQALMSTASSVEAASNAQYRMAIYTFNYSGTSVIQTLTSNLSTAATSAGNIDVLEVCSNNWLTCSNNNSDTDTNFESAMSNINGIMPAPGSGTAGSSPQEVLFLVTDGVDDEIATSCSQPKTGSRCQQPFNTTWCTTVKNRGILIAVLYTAYLPLPTNSWYNQWIAPFQSQIAPNMQSCASPGLYFQVTTDGDITAAMQALFEQAVAAARLKQ